MLEKEREARAARVRRGRARRLCEKIDAGRGEAVCSRALGFDLIDVARITLLAPVDAGWILVLSVRSATSPSMSALTAEPGAHEGARRSPDARKAQ